MIKEQVWNQVESLCTEVLDDEEFTRFLRFCVERLSKDDTVQAIWSDWQALTAQTDAESQAAHSR